MSRFISSYASVRAKQFICFKKQNNLAQRYVASIMYFISSVAAASSDGLNYFVLQQQQNLGCEYLVPVICI